MTSRSAPRFRLVDAVLGAAVAGVAWVQYRQFAAHGRALLRIGRLESAPGVPDSGWDPLPIGSVVPDFAARDLAGETIRLTDLRGSEIDLVFVDPDDPLSFDVVAAVQSLEPSPDDPRPVLVSTGSRDATRRCIGDDSPFIVVHDGMVIAQRLEVPAVPATYRLDSSGYLVAMHIGVAEVVSNLHTRAHGAGPRLVPPVTVPQRLVAGDVAPAVPTTGADGSITYLSMESDRPSIVLFADPDHDAAVRAAASVHESAMDLLAVVTQGGPDAAERLARAAGLDGVDVVADCGAWDRYAPLGVPAAFAVGSNGVLLRSEATGLAAITDLLEEFS